MTETPPTEHDPAARRLSTIVAIDVAGYSAQAEADEAGAVNAVIALSDRISATARTHGGRVFNTAGDGFMLEFPTVTGALAAAEDLTAGDSPSVRIGVHVDEVAVRPSGDLLGHGVNIAARLQALAPPGGIRISGAAQRAVHGPLADRMVACGEAQLDRMQQVVSMFTLAAAGGWREGLEVPPAPAAAPDRARDDQPRAVLVAVLPFDNMSNDPELLYFSDGVSEAILETVARSTQLRVIGRTSSFQFRGTNKTTRLVTGELHASHILDGSVRRSGDRVRISAHFIECATHTTLWSQSYDRDLGDVFVLQDEIAAAVATALDRTFAPSGSAKALAPEALDVYLRARNRRFQDVNIDHVVEEFETVVGLAPRFAPGWAGLAQASAFRARSGVDEETFAIARDRALEAAEAALRLDHRAGLAFAARSYLQPFARYGEREALLASALLNSPNDADALDAMALFCLSVGRWDEGAALALEAYRLDPLYPVAANMHAVALRTVGKVEESLALCDQLHKRWPQLGVIMMNGAFAAAFGQDWPRFETYAAALRRLGIDGEITRWTLSLEALRNPGPTARAEQLERLRREVADTGMLQLPGIVLGHALGLQDEVFDLIDQASFSYMHDERGALVARTAPTFIFSRGMSQPLMRDVRFVTLCAKLGLCDYWVATNRWPDCAAAVADSYDFKAESARLVSGGNP
ncbi:MAG: adenylate/guanylate cyclase domain-containing protein [Phenylobacterium sp.]|nr:MAG: adenylate/guanylate cyclase domain-containing protein [Phenylobacterium sp.]